MSQLSEHHPIESASSETRAGHPIGVGLRHPHYQDALDDTSNNIDFVELHAENFFVKGGILKSLLADIQGKYPISVHGTSLGLGSEEPLDDNVLNQFAELVKSTNPMLVSEHLCFNRARVNGKLVHTGDLLPIPYNTRSLDTISAQIQRVQERIKRPLLIENLSAYVAPSYFDENALDEMSEIEFLIDMCHRTGARLLLDLNNLLVNALNQQISDPVSKILADLAKLPSSLIGEIHLAGFSKRKTHGFYIDDHGAEVTDECWQLLTGITSDLQNTPILVEWDTQLPAWSGLLAQAQKARNIVTPKR